MANMSLDTVSAGRITRPLMITLYSLDKVGKTTFASHAPDVIFLDVESGSANLDVNRFPRPDEFNDLISAMSTLAGEHTFRTLAIDSIDAVERLAASAVVREAGVKSIEDIGYAGGLKKLDEKLSNFLDWCEYLRDNKGMHIIFLCHAIIGKFDNPSGESYSTYGLDARPKTSERLRNTSDCTLYAENMVNLVEEKGGFVKKHKAEATGRRVIHTEYHPAHVAGNRIGLPPIIDLDGKSVWEWIDKNHYGNQKDTK